MTVAVATILRGRHAHLDRQIAALAESVSAPVAHVVVSMDDDAPRLPGCDVVHMPIDEGTPLPLAAARNRAVSRASEEHGADLVVMLDVDCLPSPMLLRRYELAARNHGDALLSGPVRYLPTGVPEHGPLPSSLELAQSEPHPARPAPAPGVLLAEPRVELFWSLSFAVRPAIHAVIGGFDEGYVGYGAEDTDYGRRARRAGVPLMWVGGADAYHQHHPVSHPPVEHLADIVVNARRYHARWGDWPMSGWLQRFTEMGLVTWSGAGSTVRLTDRGFALTGRQTMAN